MPGPKTHQIFYKQLKSCLDEEVLKNFPNYDRYSIFAQGHDLLIYHNFYKIHNSSELIKNIELSKKLQEFSFVDFVYSYLKNAEEKGVLDNEQIRLFIGPGYIGHHILDAFTHPMIIYYAGDHVREATQKTWQHGIVENMLDIHMMYKIEKLAYKKYPVHKDFVFDKNQFSKELKEVLDYSVEKTYTISDAGELFKKSCTQVNLYMYLFKYDSMGIKKLLFDRMDPIFNGTSSFSYHRNICDADKYLNSGHQIWLNPMEPSIKSNASFEERYKDALFECKRIVEGLEKLCQKGSIQREDIYAIVPDIASTHGLTCGKRLEIRCTKEKEYG